VVLADLARELRHHGLRDHSAKFLGRALVGGNDAQAVACWSSMA
jgi:hypothetical protein